MMHASTHGCQPSGRVCIFDTRFAVDDLTSTIYFLFTVQPPCQQRHHRSRPTVFQHTHAAEQRGDARRVHCWDLLLHRLPGGDDIVSRTSNASITNIISLCVYCMNMDMSRYMYVWMCLSIVRPNVVVVVVLGVMCCEFGRILTTQTAAGQPDTESQHDGL